MRAMLFFFLPGMVWAQQTEDARRLLEQVVQTANAMNTVRAEGDILLDPGRNAAVTSTRFTVEAREPNYLRFERTGNAAILIVCDGTTRWNYTDGSQKFFQGSPATARTCKALYCVGTC